jgi:hypothetical protein
VTVNNSRCYGAPAAYACAVTSYNKEEVMQAVFSVGPLRPTGPLFSTASRQTLGPTQPPIQWGPGALSPGVKLQGRESDHSPPSSAEDKNGGAVRPLPHTFSWHNADLIKHRDKSTFMGQDFQPSCPSIYAEVSYLKNFRPKFHIHFLSHLCDLHATAIPTFSIAS